MSDIEKYEYISKRVTYCTESGGLYWNDKIDTTTPLGLKVAGSDNGRGWWKINFKYNGKMTSLRVHRIVWFMHTGEVPSQIDHINRIRHDNRIENLRNVTAQENLKNKAMYSTNTSGEVGVWHDVSNNRYRVYLSKQGRTIWVGSFKSMSDAVVARDAAYSLHGFHPTHGKHVLE